MVKRRNQFDVTREQHPVAEDVARHITDTDYREVSRLCVDAYHAKMALDRFPRASCRDAHRLMVVSNRASGSEGIAEPEPVFFTNRICIIREPGCPLVRSHDQVWVISIMSSHLRWGNDLALHQVVGQIQ